MDFVEEIPLNVLDVVPFSTDTELTVYFVVYCCVASFVIISNAVILLLLIKEHKRRRRSHRFITSMVVSDLCSGLVGITYACVIFVPTFRQEYLELCLLKIACTCSFRYNSLLIKLTVAIDRYWAVVHPIDYFVYSSDTVIRGNFVICRLIKTSKVNLYFPVMILITYTLSVFLSLIGILFREPKEACTFNNFYMFTILYSVMPFMLLITVLLCLRICWALKNREFIHKFELNATTLMMISIAVACVLWIPAIVMYGSYHKDRGNYRKMFIYLFFYYAHPIFNAFLYGYAINKKSRKLFN